MLASKDVSIRQIIFKPKVFYQYFIFEIWERFFMSVTRCPGFYKFYRRFFIAGHSSMVWNNILITTGRVQQKDDNLPIQEKCNQVFFLI